MNDYYQAPANKIPVTTIRSGVRNSDAAAVEAGFDVLPSEDDIKRVQYSADVSTLNTLYEITTPYTVTAYREGLEITFKAALANGASPSISVDGLTNEPIQDINGAVLVANIIQAGQIVTLVRNPGASGTGFQLVTSLQTTDVPPSAIAITDLGVGTGTSLDGIRINEAGTAVEAFDEIAEMHANALSF